MYCFSLAREARLRAGNPFPNQSYLTRPGRCHDHNFFGRITEDTVFPFTLSQGSIVAESAGSQQQCHLLVVRGINLLFIPIKFAFWLVAFTGNLIYLPSVKRLRTVIWFKVSVPVLSEQMTVADPSVSTATSFRTMELRRAIARMPIDSTTVTTAGRPFGREATAAAIASINRSNSFMPCSKPTITRRTQAPRKTNTRYVPQLFDILLQGRLPADLIKAGSYLAYFSLHTRSHCDTRSAPP